MTMATMRKLEVIWGSWRLYTRKLEFVWSHITSKEEVGGRLEICQKNFTTHFLGIRILHPENVQIVSIFASKKQSKYIIISNLVLFWLKLKRICKFISIYEESLHYVCVNLQNMLATALFSGKIYTANTNFIRPPVMAVATNFNSGWRLSGKLTMSEWFTQSWYVGIIELLRQLKRKPETLPGKQYHLTAAPIG